MEQSPPSFEQLPKYVYELGQKLDLILNRLEQPAVVNLPEDETPLNIQQAADFLNVSRQTIYQNIKKIPHRKRHGRLYFFKTELSLYLNHSV